MIAMWWLHGQLAMILSIEKIKGLAERTNVGDLLTMDDQDVTLNLKKIPIRIQWDYVLPEHDIKNLFEMLCLPA